MYKIVVFIEGDSNKPFDVFDLPTDRKELIKFMVEATKNPKKYRVEMHGSFIWNENVTYKYLNFFMPIYTLNRGESLLEALNRSESLLEDVSPEDVSFLAGFIQGMAIFENLNKGE